MSNLPIIVVDPYLVMLPEPCQSAEQIQTFVDGLLEWSETLQRKDLDVLLAEECIFALLNENKFPRVDQCEILVQEYYDSEIPINAKRIYQIAQDAIRRTPCLEEYLGIACALYELCHITPDMFHRRLGKEVEGAFFNSIAYLGFWQQCMQQGKRKAFFATAPYTEGVDEQELSIVVEIHEVEFFGENTTHHCQLPVQINEAFHICFGYNDVLAQYDTLAIWNNAATEAGARDAISKKVAELIAQGLPGEIAEFTFGKNFLESVQRFGTNSSLATTIIESCARILLGKPKNPINPFRESDQSPKQRFRAKDSASAWRTHLTESHEGFRLMFWKRPDGVIEFANVGVKKELMIEEN